MKSYFKFIIAVVGIFFGAVFFNTDAVHAAAAQMRVLNSTHANYSTGSTYSTLVKANPGDTLGWRMFYNGDSVTTFTVIFPAGINVPTSASEGVFQQLSADTIRLTVTPGTVKLITFSTTVGSAPNLSSNHSLSVSFSTNGNPTTSDTATVVISPIVTAITPSSGSNASPVAITSIAGHGFTAGASSPTVTVSLSDGTALNMTGATVTDTLITGPNLSIPGLHAPGSFYVIVTTDDSTGDTLPALSNAAAASESVQYTVADGEPPVMATGANSFNHTTGVLTLNFNETIKVASTNPANITLFNASSGGSSLALTGAALPSANATAVALTLTQTQINTISTWGQTANTLYVQIGGSAIYDLSNNPLSNQGSRTLLDLWTKDTTKPTVTAFSITQGSNSSGTVRAGAAAISLTMSEALNVAPLITITQPGTASTTNASLTAGANNTYTYIYTVNTADGSNYIDGAATVTLATAADYGNNIMNSDARTFAIDTSGPTVPISTLAVAPSGSNAISLSWTPTYTAADFSTYKIFYGTATGVSSSNGTEINKNTAGLSALGTAATNTANITGLTADTAYFAVIYICDNGNNCSSISNEATARTAGNAAVLIIPSGGGGGSSAPSTPTTASSAGTITTSGGAITTTLAGGSSATVVVPADSFTANSMVSVSEATSAEKVSAPIAAGAGVIIPNTIFNIQASSAFSQPVTLEFVYDPTQLGSVDPNTLSISYFSTTDNKWVSLSSSVNTITHKVSAQTTHFTLFAITTVPPASGAATTETTPSPTEITPESGQVLGSAVGVYPNGTLLKAPGLAAVWQITGDQKHLIASAVIFKTHYKGWDQVVYLPSSRQLDLYEAGDNVKFAVNTLVKEVGKSDVYRVSDNGGLQPVVSEAIFKSRGYSFKDVIEVEPGLLANYPRQAYVADASTLYSGELVRVAVSGPQAAAVYYVEGGQARKIPSRDIFDTRAFSMKRVRTINRDVFNQLARGVDLNYPGGALVRAKDSQKTYVIADNRKREISPEDFKALLYRERNVKIISETQLAQLPEAGPIRLVQGDLHAAGE